MEESGTVDLELSCSPFSEERSETLGGEEFSASDLTTGNRIWLDFFFLVIAIGVAADSY